MATANYMTMENFPLFVKEFNTQIKRCPACGLYQDCENDVCEECGEELEEEIGMSPVLWSVDSLDWKLKDKGKIVRRVLKDVKDGDIILMHDIFPSSVEAALELIDILQKEGYVFVTADELLIE